MTDMKNVVLTTIQSAAQPTAAALGMTSMLPVDEGSLGDFPWFWQNGTSFNANTYNWLNHLFAYNNDGYVTTDGTSAMTAYYNVMQQIAYTLDAADTSAYTAANQAASAVAQAVVTDYTSTIGPFPGTVGPSLVPQLNYVMSQVLGWGTPGLTLGQLRSSINPRSLLPNVPLGADQLVDDLMTYLSQTASIANIQAAAVSFNAQITDIRNNLTTMPATATKGYMTVITDGAQASVVPQITIDESVPLIQSALHPASGTGNSFSATYTVSNMNQSTMQLSAAGGASATGDVDFFLTLSAGANWSYNMSKFDESQSGLQVTLTFNGVTTVTPAFAPFQVTDLTGYWDPLPIREAANPPQGQSSYGFTAAQPYDFGPNGDFGFISRLMISQQPVITLVYSTSNVQAFQDAFKEQASFSVSFLGIPLGGASQSSYTAHVSQNSQAGTVTITLSPPATPPGAATDQLAYVVGAQMQWPGAAESQAQLLAA